MNGAYEALINRGGPWTAGEKMTFLFGDGPVSYSIQGLEWIIILIVLAVLFIFGPQKIPQLLRGIGRGVGEFQKGKAEIERELKQEMAEASTDEERREFEGKVIGAAKGLGLDVEARGQREIKLEIAKTLDKAPKGPVVAAAKTLNVPTEGVPLQKVREGIIRKLGV